MSQRLLVESGRAGRDGKPSDCILFYRLADVFKLSTMVFTQQTGLQNLYGIVDYCLDPTKCRRAIIASHFDESWESTHCDKMCDHCKSGVPPKEVDITKHCRSLLKLLTHASSQDTKMTAQKLLEAWYGKGPPKLRLSSIAVPSFSRITGDNVLARLLVDGYLKEDFHFTAYSTISYIRKGPKASRVDDPNHVISMKLAGKAERPSTNSSTEKSDHEDKPVIKTSTSTKVKKETVKNGGEGNSGTSVGKKRTHSESENTPKRTKVFVIEDSDSE